MNSSLDLIAGRPKRLSTKPVRWPVWLPLICLFLSTVGASTTIKAWADISSFSRWVFLVWLLMAVILTTNKIQPQFASLSKAVFSGLTGLAIISAISTIWSFDWVTTLTSAVVFACFLLLVYRLSTRRWLSKIQLVEDLFVLHIILTFVSLLGFVTAGLGITSALFGGRYAGVFANANSLSQISALGIFLAIGFFLKRKKFLTAIWILPPLISVLLSESRTGFLAIGIGLLVLIARAGIKGLIFTLFSTTPLIFFFYYLNGASSISTLGRFSATEGDYLSGRGLIWENSISILTDQPLGFGWGNASLALYSNGFRKSEAHNSFIQTGLDGGLISILLLLAVYVAVLLLLFIAPKDIISNSLAGVVAAGLMIQLGESSVFGFGQVFPYIFWFSVGALIALHTMEVLNKKKVSGVKKSRAYNQFFSTHRSVRFAE